MRAAGDGDVRELEGALVAFVERIEREHEARA
jgi:hypothetical protein